MCTNRPWRFLCEKGLLRLDQPYGNPLVQGLVVKECKTFGSKTDTSVFSRPQYDRKDNSSF